MIDPWLPKEYKIAQDVEIKNLIFSNDTWQIYKTNNNKNLLVSRQPLVDKWVDQGLLNPEVFFKCDFGGDNFSCLLSSDRFLLAPLSYKFFEVDKVSALAFAKSLKETRNIVKNLPLDNAIYVEQYARLLPVNELSGGDVDDSMLLGTWLTGGVAVPTTSIRRLKSLTANFSKQDLEEIIEAAGIEQKILDGQLDSDGAFLDDYEPRKTAHTKPSKFSLPGATYLENFFYENVIDIVQNSERYESLGIGFPSPIILYGKPGTGKTYAVEKLAEFLDWPVYSINSSSIGSPYIHQTGQKIAEVFNKAFDTSPSIVIIDEMEAYLSKRDGAQDFKVEEIGEFLRLIPEAPKNKVLVVGMTNLIDNIDPAILRTGRFDHKIEVKMPTAEDIKSMLDTSLAKLPKDDNLNLDKVIEALTDKPRSDVAFVVKEAARLTAFRGKDKISQQEIDDALEAKALKSATDKPKRRIGFNNEN
ncbi:MAG: AAA family ATPase [Alphaproteobacteria bacterium]|jgi:cell division protease FtsH